MQPLAGRVPEEKKPSQLIFEQIQRSHRSTSTARGCVEVAGANPRRPTRCDSPDPSPPPHPTIQNPRQIPEADLWSVDGVPKPTAPPPQPSAPWQRILVVQHPDVGHTDGGEGGVGRQLPEEVVGDGEKEAGGGAAAVDGRRADPHRAAEGAAAAGLPRRVRRRQEGGGGVREGAHPGAVGGAARAGRGGAEVQGMVFVRGWVSFLVITKLGKERGLMR